MSKAAKLLKGVSSQVQSDSRHSVSVHKLGAYIASKVVEVNVSTSLQLGWTRLPDIVHEQTQKNLLLGGNSFYGTHVTKASISWLPKEYRSELENLRNSISQRKGQLCVSKNYMPTEAYDEFVQDFAKAHQRLFELRGKIIANWDAITASYEAGVRNMFKSVKMTDAEKELAINGLLSVVPAKEQFEEDFAADMRICSFPTEPKPNFGSKTGIADKVSEAWKNEVLVTAISAVKNSIDEGWKRVNRAMRQILSNRNVHAGTISSIVRYAKDLSFKNLFNNKLLKHLQGNLTRLPDMSREQQKMAIRNAIIMIYQYSKDTQLDLDMEISAYSADALDKLCKEHPPIRMGLISQKAMETKEDPKPSISAEILDKPATEKRTAQRTSRRKRLVLCNRRRRMSKSVSENE